MSTASPSQELRELPVDLIEPNLSQPRRYLDEAALEALAGSVRDRGVLQPVLVRCLQDGKYQLVAGERRWRAAKIAGLQTIPALVSAYDDLAALEVGLIENMAREDLNPVEEARACATLAKELGLTHQQIGERVGCHKSVVSNLIRLLNLSSEILELMERGELSEGHGVALLSAQDPQVRKQLASATIEEGWSVNALRAHVRQSNVDEPRSRRRPEGVGLEGEREKGRDAEQEPDVTVMNIARVWGDVLGVEVSVRVLRSRKLRLEVVFDSPEMALALGGRLAEQIARGKQYAR